MADRGGVNSPTEICFLEAPLNEVLEYLKVRHQIEVQIDHKAFEDVGIGADTPVTIDLKGISLRSALNLMLKRLSLTWIIEDEVLMITTPEEAEQQLLTKLYEVADLVTCRDEHDVLWEDYDTLIDVIASTIKPTSWDMEGGPGSIKGATLGTAKVLVVSETREVHEQIADLLVKIREVARKTPNVGMPRRNRPAPRKASSLDGLRNKYATAADQPARTEPRRRIPCQRRRA